MWIFFPLTATYVACHECYENFGPTLYGTHGHYNIIYNDHLKGKRQPHQAIYKYKDTVYVKRFEEEKLHG